ncbi:hypothetical protein ACP70R_007368 [Stipagrostis hirtigluma subsp. patula]
MRRRCYGDLMCVMALFLLVVLLGCLALPVQCARPEPLEAATTVATAVNSTSLDESKIYLVFCIEMPCNYFGRGYEACVCCNGINQKDHCHQTTEDCLSSCPACNPKCPSDPPHQAVMQDHQLVNATTKAILYK